MCKYLTGSMSNYKDSLIPDQMSSIELCNFEPDEPNNGCFLIVMKLDTN